MTLAANNVNNIEKRNPVIAEVRERNGQATKPVTKFLIGIGILVFAFLIAGAVLFGALSLGNKAITDTLFNSDFDIGNSGLETAEAWKNSSNGGSNGSINVGPGYTGPGYMVGSTPNSTSAESGCNYWVGKDSGYNLSFTTSNVSWGGTYGDGLLSPNAVNGTLTGGTNGYTFTSDSRNTDRRFTLGAALCLQGELRDLVVNQGLQLRYSISVKNANGHNTDFQFGMHAGSSVPNYNFSYASNTLWRGVGTPNIHTWNKGAMNGSNESTTFSDFVQIPKGNNYYITFVMDIWQAYVVSGRAYNVQVYDMSFRFYSKDATAPTITPTQPTTWVQSGQSVAVGVTDASRTYSSRTFASASTHYVFGTSYTASSTPYNNISSTLPTGASISTGASSFTLSGLNAGVTVYAKDFANNIQSRAMDATYLRIDSTAPTLDKAARWVESTNWNVMYSDGPGTPAAKTNQRKGGSVLWVRAYDAGSGIKTVKVTNRVTGKEYTMNLNTSGQTSGSAVTNFYYNNPNGGGNSSYQYAWYYYNFGTTQSGYYFDVTVEDMCGNIGTFTGSSGGGYNDNYDNQAPVEDVAPEYMNGAATGTTTGFTSGFNTANWTNQPVSVRFTIYESSAPKNWDTSKDYADYSTSVNNSAIEKFMVSYTLNGTPYSVNILGNWGSNTISGSTHNSSNYFAKTNWPDGRRTPNNDLVSFVMIEKVDKSLPSQASGYTTSHYWKYTFVIVLPWSISYSFEIRDRAQTMVNITGAVANGSSGTVVLNTTGTGNVLNLPSFKPNIDSTAPNISSRTAMFSGYDATVSYVFGLPTISASAADAASTTAVPNNGSGLASIYIYEGTAVDSSKVLASWTTGGNAGTSYSASGAAKSNSCIVPSYLIVATDKAGNSTQMTGGALTVDNLSFSNFYTNPTAAANKTIAPLVDNIAPTVSLWSAASGGTCLSTGSTQNYTFPWTKVATATLYIEVTFGCSGGQILSNMNGGSFTATGTTYPQGNSNASYNKNDNKARVAFSKTGTGEVTYQYQFRNGPTSVVAGAQTGTTTSGGIITTRIDTTNPTAKIIGFGTSTDGTSITAGAPGFTEANVVSGWRRYTGGTYLWILISDTAPSYGKSPIPYGLNGTGSSQTMDYGNASVKFKHNGYEYTENAAYTSINGKWVVGVRVWDLNEIKKAKKGATGIYNTTTGLYDIDTLNNTPLEYEVTVYDFVGNSALATTTAGGTSFRYNVDPFEMNVFVVDAYVEGGAKYYGAWTSKKVTFVLKKQLGLAPNTKVEYSLYSISTNSSGVVIDSIDEGLSPIQSNGNTWFSVTRDNSSGALAVTAELDMPPTSNCYQIVFRMSSDAYTTDVMRVSADMYWNSPNTWKDNATDGDGVHRGETKIIYVRQDTSPPILKEFFFATRPDLTLTENYAASTSIVLHYIAYKSGSTYKFARKNNSGTDANVFSLGSNITARLTGPAMNVMQYENKTTYASGLYLYIIATDRQDGGVGMGAGIRQITVSNGSTSATLYQITDATFASSTGTDGTGKQTKNEMYYNTGTDLGLFTSMVSGTMFGYLTANDTGVLNFTLEDKQLNIHNFSANTSNCYNELDSTGANKGTTVNGMKPLPIIDLTAPKLTIYDATYGMSSTPYYDDVNNKFLNGAMIKDPINMLLSVKSGLSGVSVYVRTRTFKESLSDSDPFKAYNTPADGTAPFGHVSQISLSGWGSPIFSNVNAVSSNITYNILSSVTDTVKNRYDFLIVTRAGAFFYLEAGDAYIDIAPPVLDASKTYYETADGKRISTGDYNWSANVWTNQSVYAYFYVTDVGSGFYTEAGKDNVFTLINGNKTPLENVGGGYWRILLSTAGTYTIQAVDIAGNEIPLNQRFSVSPKIDKVVPSIEINRTYEYNDGRTGTYDETKFTNADKIHIVLTITFGSSGFNKVSCLITEADGTKTPYDALSISNILSVDWSDVMAGTKTAKITIPAEQKSLYEFTVYNNVSATYAASGVALTGSDSSYVRIDRTAPEILEISSQNKIDFKNVWHSEAQKPLIKAADANAIIGSGIKSVQLDWKLSEFVSADTVFFKEANGWWEPIDSNFALENYTYYTITLTDSAGNTYSEDILPRIDIATPEFITHASTANAKKLLQMSADASDYDHPNKSAYNGQKYTEKIPDTTIDFWSPYNVKAYFNMSFFISGVTLQVWSDVANKWTSVFSLLYYGTDSPDTSSTTKDERIGEEYIVIVNKDLSINTGYKLRMVSGAGVVGAELDLGMIRIDKVKPVATQTVTKDTVLPDALKTNVLGPATGATTTTLTSWIGSSLYITTESPSILVSNGKIVYSLDNGVNWVEQLSDVGNSDGGLETFYYRSNWFANGNTRLLHSLNSNLVGANYKYKYVSGSGYESEVFTVANINIDTLRPNFSALGRSTNDLGESSGSGKFNVLDSNLAAAEEKYTNLGTDAGYTSGKWTSKNSVVIMLALSNIGESGAKLYIKDGAADYELYDTLTKSANGTNRFYVVSKTTDLRFKIESEAGQKTETLDSSPFVVKIDSAIPFVYVSQITGSNKSLNWDGTKAESWYISTDTRITLRVGRLVNNGGSYVLEDSTPVSGYTIYYSINGVQQSSLTGLDIYLEGKNILSGALSSFRIVSGAGLEYTLGQTVLDNQGKPVAEYTNARVQTEISSRSGLDRHLPADGLFEYTLNVDSNPYYVTQNTKLPYYWAGSSTAEYEERSDYANYTVRVWDKNTGAFVLPAVVGRNTTFYRGDYIEISYAANEILNYVHRYTDYGAAESGPTGISWVGTTNRLTAPSFDALELSGAFTYKFNGYGLKYESYFMKELTAVFPENVLYLQNHDGSDIATNADAKYYFQDGSSLDVSVTTVSEFDISNPELGGYLISASVGGLNSRGFRVKKEFSESILLVKWFEENASANSASNPFIIKSVTDLMYVSEEYWDGFSGTPGNFVLDNPKSYLDCFFKLDNDLTLPGNFGSIGTDTKNAYSGRAFTGGFDGNGNTITLYGGNVNESYGLFELISGTVKNLNVVLANPLTVSLAYRVGILAQEIIGGTVENIYVEGDIIVAGAYGSITPAYNGLIGGVAAYASGAVIGRNASGYAVQSNVRITDLGTATIDSAHIGGILGHAENGTKLFNTYAYGFIQIDKAGAVAEIGMTIGYATGYNAYDFVNNSFLTQATFKNGEYIASTKGGTAGWTHADFVNTYTPINGAAISDNVLIKLYADFGLDSASGFNSGDGAYEPLLISDYNQLRMIDYYLGLNYKLTADMDFAAMDKVLAANTIFFGTLDGNGKTMNNFGAGLSNTESQYFGLFGRTNGAVIKNFVFDNVNVDLTYLGDKVLYAGLFAGSAVNTTFNNLIIIGETNITANRGRAVAGGLAGSMSGGFVFDIFSLNNLSLTSANPIAGGIAGEVNNTIIGAFYDDYNLVYAQGAVLSLSRVAATVLNDSTRLVGAIAGSGTFNGNSIMTSVFGIQSNTFVDGNIIANTVGSSANAYGIELANFTANTSNLRDARFGNNVAGRTTTNVLAVVFGTSSERLYPLAGLGTEGTQFVIRSNIDQNFNDFNYINRMLYASYNVEGDVTFGAGEFETIGRGFVFTGVIDGSNENSISAEDGSVSTLLNVTDALVYHNNGYIINLGVNMNLTERTGTALRAVRKEGAEFDLVFGAIAIYNSYIIRNVTVGGDIEISSAVQDTSVVVSGFVGIDYGGIVENMSKVQNSISSLNIKVVGANTVYAGGYIGVAKGSSAISYGISAGEIIIENCAKVIAGTLVGEARVACTLTGFDDMREYSYVITVNNAGVIYNITDDFGFKP